jgi:acyl carrier protein
MELEPLHRKLELIFQTVFDRQDLAIKDEMTADDIDGWDSLAQINLVVGAEDAFQVRFQTAEIKSLRNVGEFKRLIAAKLDAGR